jgi:hypothetical protein
MALTRSSVSLQGTKELGAGQRDASADEVLDEGERPAAQPQPVAAVLDAAPAAALASPGERFTSSSVMAAQRALSQRAVRGPGA